MASLLAFAINASGTSAGRSLRSAQLSLPGVTSSVLPPRVTMPRPSQPPSSRPPIATPTPNRGPSSNARLGALGGTSGKAVLGNMAFGAGVGAITGGVYSGSDGFSLSGSIRGAMGGAAVGSLAGFGLPAAAKMAVGNNRFMSTAGSYSSKMVDLGRTVTSSHGRQALFGAGGLLGGSMMSGEGKGSKARGFNSNRGSRIQGY